MRFWITGVFVAGAALLHLSVQAGTPAPIVYPAKGQSADQTKKDESECHAWAAQNVGFDPAKPAPTASNPPAQQQQPSQQQASGHRTHGAVRGALLGAAVGEIADNDAGEGAAYGALAGALASGRKARVEAAKQQEQAAEAKAKAQQEAAAQQATQLDGFNRANTACLEGRGYVVK